MTSSDELQSLVEKLQSDLVDAQAALAPLADEFQKHDAITHSIKASFDEQIQALKDEAAKQIREAWEKRNEAYKAQQENQQVVLNAQYKLNSAKAEVQKKVKEEEAAAQAEQAAIAASLAKVEKEEFWDKLTMRAPWREWAKEHQMTGARKIVEDRYVILADPMGLGKTLTAIITCEMADKGSVDASPEHPWLGQEVEVYVPEQFYSIGDGHMNGNNGVRESDGLLTGYIDYDRKTRMRNDTTNYRVKPAGYETEIQNAIKRPVGRKVLYLCPSSLLGNVLSEFKHWAPHRNATYIGGFPKVVRDMVLDNARKLDDAVIICNYEAWRRDNDLINTLIDMEFDTVIIDEAHNAKNVKSNIYKGIDKIVNADKRPEYVIPMTGTPILNKPEELYTLLHMVNPVEFHNTNAFLRDYCEQYLDENSGQVKWRFRPGGLDTLVKKLSTNFMRRSRTDAGVELPPKTITIHELKVDKSAFPLQAKAREQMRKFATIILNEQKGTGISAMAKIAMFTRLRQIETWPAGIVQRDKHTKEITLQVDIEESQKLDYIINHNGDEWEGLIPDVIGDERVVVFSQFKAPLAELAKRITAAGYRPVIMDGDTSDEQRTQIARDFDNKFTANRGDSKWDVVLCNYRVGGVGLNLTAATQMIICDEEWNPGKRDQAYDRIHRMGQDKPVTIHVIRNTPTIDNWLAGIMASKESIVDGFEDAMNNSTSSQDILDALESGLI